MKQSEEAIWAFIDSQHRHILDTLNSTCKRFKDRVDGMSHEKVVEIAQSIFNVQSRCSDFAQHESP